MEPAAGEKKEGEEGKEPKTGTGSEEKQREEDKEDFSEGHEMGESEMEEMDNMTFRKNANVNMGEKINDDQVPEDCFNLRQNIIESEYATQYKRPVLVREPSTAREEEDQPEEDVIPDDPMRNMDEKVYEPNLGF